MLFYSLIFKSLLLYISILFFERSIFLFNTHKLRRSLCIFKFHPLSLCALRRTFCSMVEVGGGGGGEDGEKRDRDKWGT